MDYDSGNVVFRTGLKVGYLQQMPEFAGDMTVLQAVMPAVLGPEDWNIEDRAKQILSQFKINDFAQPIAQLSGGQVKRVALARVLLSEPEMLILDEPTNHLDIEMIEWMEKYLSKQNITLLMVTHDRYFLDNVCNKIIEIDREQTFTYNGNYDYYLQKREERMENLTAELAKVKNLLRTELEWMRRQPQARGSKAKYRIDNFYELEKRSQVNLSERNVELAVKGSYIGSKIFEAKDICKSYGDKVILKDWNYTFARYDKVGIVGDNGVGKSTFIKLLLGLVEPDSGHFDIGQTVKWGYYSQDGIEFDESKKVIDAVREIAEEIHIDEKTRLSASQFLSHFLFAPDTQQKFIHKLSGGEKRRLYLATVLMRNPNFLILDEPTNDLDIVTLSVLEDYLSKFKGCVIVVSHDRFFLDRIVDHLFVFKGNGVVKDFPGDYSTYRHCLDMESKMAKTEAKAESAKTTEQRKPKRDNSNKLSYKEKRELEELEKRLPELETEKNELEGRMSTGEMSTDELLKASQRVSALIDEIDMVEMRMLELMEKEG
jgi:ATP-binding cassette subfamily F protein uup